MKIQSYDRVQYNHNPLAEVICQVRFPYAPSLSDAIPESILSSLAALGYTERSEEQVFSISIAIPPQAQAETPLNRQPTSKIFHLATASEAFKVSICADFVALSCNKYLSWEDFRPRFIAAYKVVRDAINPAFPVRIGLRYKDVIEREPLGLDGVAWSELIKPFLLGPLGACALSDDKSNSEDSVAAFVTQATLRLDECDLVLQSALLRSAEGDRTAFLIDSDFFADNNDPECYKEDEQLLALLGHLHNHAGSLFRRGITETLHAALGPRPI
jgi:uncharacterized protein (TIGR04255 family)